MNDPSIPPPQHREKLLNLSTRKTVNASEARLDLNKIAGPAPGSASVEPEEESLHVNPIGENWEVESDTGTLGQADTKSEAEKLASDLAEEAGVEKVTIHTAD